MSHLLISRQGFSSFFVKFLPYLMVFQSGPHWRRCRTLKNWQKMKENIVENALNPFFGWFLVPKNLISGIWSDTSLYCIFVFWREFSKCLEPCYSFASTIYYYYKLKKTSVIINMMHSSHLFCSKAQCSKIWKKCNLKKSRFLTQRWKITCFEIFSNGAVLKASAERWKSFKKRWF